MPTGWRTSTRRLTSRRRAAEPNEYLKRRQPVLERGGGGRHAAQVLDLVGEGQIVFGSDIPHSDRERFAAKTLLEREDVSESGKRARSLRATRGRLYAL